MKKPQKGFTIIELIVVIAIIAVLAGIVLVNVIQYINKSKDTKVKAELSQIAKGAIVNYEKNGSYANTLSAVTPCEGTYVFIPSTTAFVAYHKLCTDPTKYWCVDSVGSVKELSNIPDAGVYTCTEGTGDAGGENGGWGSCDGIECQNGLICVAGICVTKNECGNGECEFSGANEDCNTCELDCACIGGQECVELEFNSACQ
ncbi:MAG: prepilin-type N-terminal cleavage/methylation domain-containing protein [Candidatus Staskawiczbacteria bacterium]|jgi:prepilin-type N-terminal cleavage/methylation domain-containing protein